MTDIKTLIVEDDMMLSMVLEEMLNEIGIYDITVAQSIDEALEQIEITSPSMTFLDLHLNKEMALPVAYELQEKNMPFYITSGADKKPSELASLDKKYFIKKPYSIDDLKSAYISENLMTA